jgi:hypothetical protein
MEILGELDSGKIGLALIKQKNYRILYSAVPAMPSELLREIIRTSGLPVYNSYNGDATWAAGGLFSVHSKSGGERTFTPPVENGIATELISSAEFPIRNGKFNYKLAPQSTVFFYCRNSTYLK